MELVVGIGEFAVSADPEDVLVTYSLGSCVGVIAYDERARVGGLLHAQLPASKADPERAVRQPGVYVDSGTTAMLQAMFDLCASRKDLTTKVVGAASSFSGDDMFRIGERNHTVLRRVLWKNGILIAAEDVGGTDSRTVVLDVLTGTALVKSRGSVSEL